MLSKINGTNKMFGFSSSSSVTNANGLDLELIDQKF